METLLSPTVLLIPSLWWEISEAGAGVPPGSLGQKVLAWDSPWERLAPLEHRQGQDPFTVEENDSQTERHYICS